MRILSIHNYYQQPGGEDVVFESEAELLEENGHSVERLIFRNETISESRSVFESARLAINTVWSRTSYRRVQEAIRDFRPDVAHFHNTFPLVSPSGYAACRDAGIPVVQTLHNFRILCTKAQFFREGRVCEDCLGRRLTWPGIVHGCYRDSRPMTAAVTAMQTGGWIRGSWTRDVDRYIVFSPFGKQKFIQGGIPATQIDVKPNFLSPDPGFQSGGGGFALFVGRLSPEKGIETLLQAWSSFSPRFPLRIVGDGPMAEAVERAAAENERIEWLGRRSFSEVLEAMGSADILVFPSLWFEGMPRTVIESLAVGTPLVASDLGGTSDLIQHGVNGMLFKAGDASALADAARKLMDESTGTSRLRENCRASFENQFTAHDNYRQLISIYERVFAEQRSA